MHSNLNLENYGQNGRVSWNLRWTITLRKKIWINSLGRWKNIERELKIEEWTQKATNMIFKKERKVDGTKSSNERMRNSEINYCRDMSKDPISSRKWNCMSTRDISKQNHFYAIISLLCSYLIESLEASLSF